MSLRCRNELTEMMKEEGLDFLTLVDKKGVVLFRVHHPEQSGDSLLRDPFIQKGLEKKPLAGTQILSEEELLREGKPLCKKLLSDSSPHQEPDLLKKWRRPMGWS